MLSQRTSNPGTSSGHHPQHQHQGPPHAQGEIYIGVYDFETSEADQVSFRKNDVLTIVHKEHSGWWAVLTENGKIGWVPAAYLEPLSISMRDLGRTSVHGLSPGKYSPSFALNLC